MEENCTAILMHNNQTPHPVTATYTELQPNLRDLNSSTVSDPFSDEFFQKTFDTPSVQSVSVPSRLSMSSSERQNGISPASSSQYTSTPEDQALPCFTSPQFAMPQLSRGDIWPSLTPFETGYQVLDPFQSSFESTGQSNVSTTPFEATNHSQDPTSSVTDLPCNQSSLHDSPFFSQVQHPLGFSPGTASPVSVAISDQSSGLSGSNPFMIDSPPFSSGIVVSAPSTTTQSSISQSAGRASFQSDTSDPFADLTPFISRTKTTPPAQAKSSSPQTPTQVTQSVPQLVSKPKWDTFESPTITLSSFMKPMRQLEQSPLSESNVFDAFEDGFQEPPPKHNHTLTVSSSCLQRVTANDITPTAGFEDSFQSPQNAPATPKRVVDRGFKYRFQDQYSLNFDEQFEGIGMEQGTGSRQLEAFESSVEAKSTTVAVTHLPSQGSSARFDSGFDDHFVQFSDWEHYSSNSDIQSVAGKPSQSTWVSFS